MAGQIGLEGNGTLPAVPNDDHQLSAEYGTRVSKWTHTIRSYLSREGFVLAQFEGIQSTLEGKTWH